MQRCRRVAWPRAPSDHGPASHGIAPAAGLSIRDAGPGEVNAVTVRRIPPSSASCCSAWRPMQRSVRRFGEGDLSARVAETGPGRKSGGPWRAVAFNAAAARIQTLVQSAPQSSCWRDASHLSCASSPHAHPHGAGLMQRRAGPRQPSGRDGALHHRALDQLADEILQ